MQALHAVIPGHGFDAIVSGRIDHPIRNQWIELSAAETAAYWQAVTPPMDPNVARKYAYLPPSPGHGLEYTQAAAHSRKQ